MIFKNDAVVNKNKNLIVYENSTFFPKLIAIQINVPNSLIVFKLLVALKMVLTTFERYNKRIKLLI